MTMTLGPAVIVSVCKRTLPLPLAVLSASVLGALLTGKSGWLSVGGAAISALGAHLWAWRIFRQRPERADDPLPPATFPPKPGSPGVQLNMENLYERGRRALDNWYSYIGVWLTIAGGIIGSAGPFLWDEVPTWF